MPEYCTCGAQLPPDARFCHKCGRPLFDYPPVEEDAAPAYAPASLPESLSPSASPDITFHNRLAVRIGLTTALIAFLLTSFPLPAFITVLRLLIAFIAAGFFAVYLYQRRTGQPLTIRNGARLGWITGVFSFAIATVFFASTLLLISNQGGIGSLFRRQVAANDPNALQFLKYMENPATMAGILVFVLVILFVIYTLLPMVGGALCAKVLEKD